MAEESHVRGRRQRQMCIEDRVTQDVDEALVLADRVLVMTNRPGKILTEVGVEFPRPRTTQTLTLPKFTELKELLLHSLAEA